MGHPDVTIHTTDRLFSAAAKGIELNQVRDGMENLERLCHYKIAAADAFRDAVKAVAVRAKIEPSVLSTYVTAIVGDKLEKSKEKAEQLDLLFAELQ